MLLVNRRFVSPVILAVRMTCGVAAAGRTALRTSLTARCSSSGRTLTNSMQHRDFVANQSARLRVTSGEGSGFSAHSLLPATLTIFHVSIARRHVSYFACATGSGIKGDDPAGVEHLVHVERPTEASVKEARMAVSRAADRGRMLVDEIFEFADGGLDAGKGRRKRKGEERGRGRGSSMASTWDGLSDDEGEEEGEEESEVVWERGRAGRGRNEAKRNAKKAKDFGHQLVELRRVDVERIVR